MLQLAPNPDVRVATIDRPFSFQSPFDGEPYALMLVSSQAVTDEERSGIAKAIIASGCRNICCAGDDCSRWENWIDWAFLETDEDFDPPDERFVMTSHHADETLAQVVWFLFSCTAFDDFWPSRYLILFIGHSPEVEKEVIAAARSEGLVANQFISDG